MKYCHRSRRERWCTPRSWEPRARRPRERDDIGTLLGEGGEDGQPVAQGGARGAAAMETLRSAVQSVEASPEADSAFASTVEAHRATVGLF